ncbi:DUF924 domain-containing protein [Candidatus Kaiserbacteria bacterium]|nr:MAG: DUF924 domain-containing protein [Candidatus Kaiserbacteria bacterium]
MNDKIIDDVLTFWFEDVGEEQWFKKDSKLDATIQERFQDVYEDVLNRETESWKETPEGRLAEIIVLDQFSRNIFRNDARSFSGDALALRLAQDAIAAGDDKKIPKEQRVFFYMPYMHSESPEVHVEALRIFIEYGDESYLGYEVSHKDIIDQFGRYPHRNEVLGRESTLEELEFLKTNSGF